MEGVGRDSIQGDVRFAEALASMGARIAMGANWMEARAPENGRMKAIDLDCNHIPDAAMTLAVCALFADGVTTLRNIASWRVKETDRIAAMATELRKLAQRWKRALITSASASTQSGSQCVIDTYDDHRMAMCFSLAAFGGGDAYQRSSVRSQDFSGLLRKFCQRRTVNSMSCIPVIAIDGPSASGKGTVAELVAAHLDFIIWIAVPCIAYRVGAVNRGFHWMMKTPGGTGGSWNANSRMADLAEGRRSAKTMRSEATATAPPEWPHCQRCAPHY